MKTVFVTLLLLISFINCSCSNVKFHPEYQGIDPKVQGLVNEYKDLAKKQGIEFNHDITLGFKKLEERGNFDIIGRCTYGWGWREVDISERFWVEATDMEKVTLILHELNHCYCERGHDYKGKDYPSPDDLAGNYTNSSEAGYYPDFCPKSLMYPIIVEDDCIKIHKEDYEKELFENCEPY